MTTTALIGDALLTKIAQLDSTLTVTQKATACGYLKDNGKVAYVDFYTALIEAKGYDIPDDVDGEDEMSETESDLRERFSDEAVDAFLELWMVMTLSILRKPIKASSAMVQSLPSNS